jgi:hypothetical protein
MVPLWRVRMQLNCVRPLGLPCSVPSRGVCFGGRGACGDKTLLQRSVTTKVVPLGGSDSQDKIWLRRALVPARLLPPIVSSPPETQGGCYFGNAGFFRPIDLFFLVLLRHTDHPESLLSHSRTVESTRRSQKVAATFLLQLVPACLCDGVNQTD